MGFTAGLPCNRVYSGGAVVQFTFGVIFFGMGMVRAPTQGRPCRLPRGKIEGKKRYDGCWNLLREG
jgi:hypothetical protein